MKKIKISIVVILGLWLGFACEDDKMTETIDTSTAIPAKIQTPLDGSSYVLLVAEGADEFDAFTWTEADFGAQVPRAYSLQLDKQNNNFANYIELVSTSGLMHTPDVATVNLALYDIGLHTGNPELVDFRIVTSVNNTLIDTLVASEVISISIDPFLYGKPNITTPEDGSAFVLAKDTLGVIDWETITWDAIDYGYNFGQKYSLQFDYADSSFINPTELAKIELSSYTGIVKTVNQALLRRGLLPSVPVELQFRVISSIEDKKGIIVGDPITLTVTPFEDQVGVVIPVIYMLGGATTAGWSNNDNNIKAYYQPSSGADSTFTAVDFLQPNGTGGSDGLIKFVRFIGQWAPQWGTDATGTGESGPLVLRPTESEPDPTAIPAPAVAGDYLVSADIVNLTYTIKKVTETLHLIGDATLAGWDNTKALPLTKDAPGKFSIITTLNASAGEGFKFLVDLGAWEPMYGQESGTWEEGYLKYRAVGAPDVTTIAPPPTTGEYLIEVDLSKNTYKLTLQ